MLIIKEDEFMTWIISNIGTIIVGLVVLVMVFLSIRSLIADRKKGCSSCGGSCSACGMAGKCHNGKV